MLELNRRVVFRRFGRGAVLYDPDRRRSLTLNSAGAELYSRLRRSGVPGAEEAELLAGFSDRRREHAERFLAMLQNAGMLAGHAGSAAAPPPEPAGEPEAAAPAGRLGVGNSMRGTFSSGDELRVEEIAATELRPGDVVMFTGSSGVNTGHRIVGGRPGSWITMGDNNDRPDAEPFRPGRLATRITGKVVRGEYFPIAGGPAGMRRFRLLRLRRAAHRALAALVNPLLRLLFWRPGPDHAVRFGAVTQYSRGDRLIGWRVNGIPVYAGLWRRFFYRLPEK